MASSSSMRKYPRRVYEVGKTPIQSKSMNHSFYLSNLQTMRVDLGEDVWSELRESAVGVIVKLKELPYIWSAKVVHHFLANQLAIESSHEIWSLIDCKPLRFSLYEFGEITGLNCDPFDKDDVWDVDHQEFWLEMNVPTSDGPTLQELQDILPTCKNWTREKRVRIGLLFLLSVGIFGISSNSRIPLHCAKRVMDTAAFQRYPWGRVGFSSLVDSIKVRVRHMIMNQVEDIYPKWDDDKINTDLDNMIKDIVSGQLNEKFWDANPTTKCEKRKYGVAASVVPNQGPSTKRRKDKESADGAQNVATLGLVESIKILTAKIEDIDVSVADKVIKALEATIDAKVEARVAVYDSDLRKIIAKLEEDINYLKNNANVNIVPDVVNSKACEDDGACSNDLSWILQKKINSQDGLPIDCVVKKEKKAKKMMEEEDLPNKEVKSTEKKAGIPLRRVKQEKAIKIPKLNDESISAETWENSRQWEKSINCRAVLEELALTLKEPTRRRKPQLTKTQVWPFVGNSTVKRIITGEKDSKEPCDPLAKVEAEKLQKVLDFIKSDLEANEPGYGDESAGFFLKIMIPRVAWPTNNYGWLHDSHIAAAMLMFHRRSRQAQSPYSSTRIAFLSRWFVSSWVNDYKNWDQKKNELPEIYSKAFNGEHPADFVTNKKWIADVDELFLCHFVNGDHWVALRIDLLKEAIHVYDSIHTHVSDKDMKEECRPFMKMIPAVLNKMMPGKTRTKREKQFSYIRHKKIPQNENPGDCGVYSLMYIECLALGRSFDGLTDQIIPPLRLKLAADIYEEVTEKAE
ncbi:Ulp1 protease family [Hirschfeldia incana]|nr:Ulp1 protease family [Hirschfeldia incana]